MSKEIESIRVTRDRRNNVKVTITEAPSKSEPEAPSFPEVHYVSDELKAIVESEGDNKVFYYRGVYCEIKRVNKAFSGHLCGYLKRPNFITAKDMASRMPSINVHGDWTYQQGDIWGFDCNHVWDIAPVTILDEIGIESDFVIPEYRTMAYVENELKHAVDELLDDSQEEND